MPKPTTIPVWATTLAAHGTTGQDNRVEPSAPKKVSGFDFNEKYSRQDLNWLQWMNGEWLTWIDSVLDQDVSTTASPTFVAVNCTTVQNSGAALTLNTATSHNIVLTPGSGLTYNTGSLVVSSQLSPLGNIVMAGGDIQSSASDMTIETITSGDLYLASVADMYINIPSGQTLTISDTVASYIINGGVHSFTGAVTFGSQITLNGSATAASVSGTNLTTLTAGSTTDASALHKHTTKNHAKVTTYAPTPFGTGVTSVSTTKHEFCVRATVASVSATGGVLIGTLPLTTSFGIGLRAYIVNEDSGADDSYHIVASFKDPNSTTYWYALGVSNTAGGTLPASFARSQAATIPALGTFQAAIMVKANGEVWCALNDSNFTTYARIYVEIDEVY